MMRINATVYVYMQPQFRDSGYATSTLPQGQAPLPAPAASVYKCQPVLPPSLPSGVLLSTHTVHTVDLLPPPFSLISADPN